MAEKDNNKAPLPPYIPFRTFQNFMRKLNETTVPDQVDKSLYRTYSGSVGRQITAALKYLGLVDSAGRTKDELKALVTAVDTPAWQQQLSSILHDSYQLILGDLNLETTTPHALDQKFKAAGCDGQVLQKCVTFFVAAQRSAGKSLSPHITNKPRKARSDKNKVRAKKAEEGSDEMTVGELRQPTGAIVKFMFPVPDKGTAHIYVPSTLEKADWEMINTMMTAYIGRLAKKQAEAE